MTLQRKISLLFAVNAFINWRLSIRGIIDPAGMSAVFFGPAPEYAYVVRLWTGFVFMFGCMFWETSRYVVEKAELAKYNWIEKSVMATAVTLGYLAGQVSDRLMLLIMLTNWAWIPFILYYDLRLRRHLRPQTGCKTPTRPPGADPPVAVPGAGERRLALQIP